MMIYWQQEKSGVESMPRSEDSRPGYYVEEVPPEEKKLGSSGFTLKPHSPEAMRMFGKLIRNGAKKRREQTGGQHAQH